MMTWQPRVVVSAVGMALAAVGGNAHAQSMNIDWGDQFGTPAPTFAGEGLAGVWNALDGSGGPHALVGLKGQVTGAMVSFAPETSAFGNDHPATMGDVEALLDDAVGGLADIVGRVTFRGLEPGHYRIIVYAWVNWDPENAVGIWLGEEVIPGVGIGGPLTQPPPQLGVTHAIFEEEIRDGRLIVNLVSGRWIFADWWLNGMQLVHSPLTCYADCDTGTGPGVLDVFDFLCFGNRFAALDPYACDCDIASGPGVCDVFDFLCFGNEFAAGCR